MHLLDGVRRGAGLAAALGRAVARTRSGDALPVEEGTLSVHGCDGRIEVVRDRWGVPHAFASTETDAAFAHGFIHAQDRLFQMEGARRLAGGRLAEIAGPSSLPSDRLMRRVGLARAALLDAERVAGPERAMLEAYARGVNAGVSSLRALPPEFALLSDRFEPWSVADTMLVGRLVMFGFAGNWVTELLREELVAAVGPERAAVLDPVHPPGSTVTGREYVRAMQELQDAFEAAVAAGLPVALSSNAWAVSGERSRTGRPLLASDPHVEVALPGLFHVAHLQGGVVDVVGAGIPGIPGVAIGHNAHVAWGITAGMADVADCYVEEFDPPDGCRYRTDRGWAEATEVVERIEVAGGEPVEERVLITRHGPVVSPALPDEARAISLYSSVIDGGEIASPFIALSRATSLDEAEAALDHWAGTTFNFVLAAVDGEIGYRFAGEVPERSPGGSLLPRAGAASTGPPPFIAPEALPRFRAPEDGIVVSANNAPGGPLELGEEWCEPRRWERIWSMLDSGDLHDVASFCVIQRDRYSANLEAFRDVIVDRGCAPVDLRLALRLWDGQLTVGSAAAALIYLTYRMLAVDLTERLAGAHAPLALGAVERPLPANSAFAYRTQWMLVRATLEASPPWFEGPDDRDRVLRGVVLRAVEYLEQRCGPVERWSLASLQRIEFNHPLGAVPGLGRWWSRGARPFGGDVNTVVQALGAASGEEMRVQVAPGYRQVLDLADWDRSVFMQPTGNSGIPGHPRYDDCIDEYLADAHRPLLFSEAAVRAAAAGVLVLERSATLGSARLAPARLGGAALDDGNEGTP